MSYTNSPNAGAWITEEALASLRKQYTLAKLSEQAAMEQLARLTKANDERQLLFEVMKTQFDLLFEEVEGLKDQLAERDREIARLHKRLKKKPRSSQTLDSHGEV